MPILELKCPTCFGKAARLPHFRSDERTLEQSFYGQELKLYRSPRAEFQGQDDDRRVGNGRPLQRICKYIEETFSASRSKNDRSDHHNARNDRTSIEHDDKQAKQFQSQFQGLCERDVEHGFFYGSKDPKQAPDSGKIITVNHFWLWMLEMNETGASMCASEFLLCPW